MLNGERVEVAMWEENVAGGGFGAMMICLRDELWRTPGMECFGEQPSFFC
jgi:hypothetical protein